MDDVFSESLFSASSKQGLQRKVKDWVLPQEEELEVAVRTEDVGPMMRGVLRFHIPQSSWALAPQLLSPNALELVPTA